MLRKERDLERERITKAATQADNAEQSIINLKQEYDKVDFRFISKFSLKYRLISINIDFRG